MELTKVKWVELGSFAKRSDERNHGEYSLDDVRGISNDKKIIKTKATLDEKAIENFKVFRPEQFCYNTATSRNGEKITLAFNDTSDTYVVSTLYVVFDVDKSVIIPEYLYLWLCRPEFDRYARYNSWGSAREYFWYDDMARVMVPLVPIEEQRAIVDAWQSLCEIRDENNRLAAPLMQLCLSFVQKCKHEYPLQELGHYIEEKNERNVEGLFSVSDVRGLSTSKQIIPTKANMEGVSVTSYKVLRPEQFAFVDDTSRRGDKISLAVNMSDDTYIVSSISTIVDITDKQKLLPQFLKLWFDRSEFDRYARFHSWGSARESFTFEDMQRVRIPVPPMDVQKAIVSLYQCALDYKAIADEADAQARSICSALMQHAIHS